MKLQSILVVDNNPVILQLVRRFFEKKGCSVKTAETGLSAIEILEEYTPDLLVIDLVMPNIGGEDICRIVRANRRHDQCAIIILSAIITECRHDFGSLGIDACVAKEDPAGMMHSLGEAVTRIESGRPPRQQPQLFARKPSGQPEITRELWDKVRHNELILQNMSDLFIELTPGGKIVQASRSVLPLLHGTTSVLGQELVTLLPPEAGEKVRDMLDRLSANHSELCEELWINDKVFTLSLQYLTTPKKDGSIVLFGNEITEHIRLKKDLEQILNSAADGMLVIGLDHSIIKVNDTFLKMFSLGDDVVGSKCYDILPGPYCHTASCPLLMVCDDEQLLESEEIKTSLNGEEIYCQIKTAPYRDYAGNLMGIIEDFRDITQIKITEQTLKESEDRFRDLFENSPDMIQNILPDGRFLFVNPAWKKMLEYTDEEIATMHFHDIVSPDFQNQCKAKFLTLLQGEELLPIETEFITKSGWRLSVIGSVSCKFKDGKPQYVRGIFRDVTHEKILEERLQRLATTDELTGLYNRRMFKELYQKEVCRAKRSQNPLSLAILDIDHFKEINDTYGHDVGDEVLKTMATLCRDAIRQEDYLARWGGEEFVLLLPDTPVNRAEELCDRVRRTIASYKFKEIERLTVSLGIAQLAGDEEEDMDTLLKRADQALYLAKETGRNTIQIR